MTIKTSNPAYALLGHKDISSMCDFPVEQPSLQLVRRMYPCDSVTEEPEHYVLHRVNKSGERLTLRMPKTMIEHHGKTKEAFYYTACNALDELLGFEDTARDGGGVRVLDSDNYLYRVLYLSVMPEPAESEELVVTIAKPGPGAKILGWIHAAVKAGGEKIVKMLEESDLQFEIIEANYSDASVLFMIDADAKGVGPETQAAWQAYWENTERCRTYNV